MAALLMTNIVTVYAQSQAEFSSEPDKSMATAHESFIKGDINKATAEIKKAATYVHAQEKKVAKDAAPSVKKAAEDLDRLGTDVEKGMVKSGDELKKTFAQVDYALATAWHATAEQEQKAGKNASAAARSAGAGLEGAAKWTGSKLDAGAQAAVDAVHTAGRGARLGVDALGRVIRGIGEGIADVGKKIGG